MNLQLKKNLIDKLQLTLSSNWACFKVPKKIEDAVLFIHEDQYYENRSEILAHQKNEELKVTNEGFTASTININKVHRYNKIKQESVKNALGTVKKAIKDYHALIDKLTYNIENGDNSIASQNELDKAYDNVLKLQAVQELKDEKETMVILSNFHREQFYYQAQVSYESNKHNGSKKKVFHLSPKRINLIIVKEHRDLSKADYIDMLEEYEKIDIINAKNDIYIPKSTLELPGK